MFARNNACVCTKSAVQFQCNLLYIFALFGSIFVVLQVMSCIRIFIYIEKKYLIIRLYFLGMFIYTCTCGMLSASVRTFIHHADHRCQSVLHSAECEASPQALCGLLRVPGSHQGADRQDAIQEYPRHNR